MTKSKKLPKNYSAAKNELLQLKSNLAENQFEVDELEDLIDRAKLLIEFCQNKLRELEEKIDKNINI